MFELLEDIKALPLPEDDIVQVHSGMNKLRVSVGNYVSEPSDVYIITSEDDALLRSCILFFVVEPGIHVVYGYAGNPYDPVFREEVLQEAVDFVEEMGAILEEVPWEKMSPEERQNWIRNESIYPLDEIEAMEEIVDLEEIEPEELQEVVEEEDKLNEGEGLLPETLEPEMLEKEEQAEAEPEEPPVKEEIEVEATGEESEEDGDFDKLLKQAFLKPDLVKKSKMKKIAALEDEPLEDEEPSQVERSTVTDEEGAQAGEKPMETDEEESEIDEESEEEALYPEQEDDEEDKPGFVVSDEELAVAEDDDLSVLIQEISAQTYAEESLDTPQEEEKHVVADSGDQTRLKVIRYLSRF